MYVTNSANLQPPLLLLDTGALSDLAREPQRAGVKVVTQLLERGEAQLVVTHGHLIEMADPRFQAHADVVRLLRSVPALIAQPNEQVADEEVAYATARLQGWSCPDSVDG